MALETSSFSLPTTALGAIVDRVRDESVIAKLSPERPTLFGNVAAVRLSRKPRAQIVAEGAQKAADDVELSSVTASPIKIQTTVRVSDEVRWADADHQMGIVDEVTTAIAGSIARAVDLIAIHGINPLTGTAATSVTAALNDTNNRVAAAGAPTDEVDEAVGLVASSGVHLPTGLGLDPAYAFALATDKDDEGRRLNPELGYGLNAAAYHGLGVARSSAVSGRPEAEDTGIRAIVGDFGQLAWGFQRNLPVSVIEFGDPDGEGDLQRLNQVAYRAEAVLYVAIFDVDAFAVVEEQQGS